MVRTDNQINENFLEDNRQMVYQGMLDDCNDYNVYEIDLEQAQEPLKPSIRPPADEDSERMHKYFGRIPAKIIQNIY